ncbi:heterotrimeric G protein alpha subunit 4 [Dacryopinax primogenitus]|uniref:Heterotrimeric G protein alpha subunit 4 n=1 Tax=Dacryopinax primogenitus (strain DJM 731) TaxID=1858805 RepID=M5FQE3_DACPD|nr:heterotrimeric G protein alpha subunit 4 [Dacryopinax primogenitus]EJT99100.1 heterotrimeric G protein alpha subunit 4 [Dacryopinax primogenitus]
MGACMSSAGPVTPEEEQAQRVNKQIDRDLKEKQAEMAKEVKVLLLGSGDSGKSTILKQMRLIHRVPFTDNEIESFRQLVFQNLLEGMRLLLEAAELLDIKIGPEQQDNIAMIEHAADLRDDQAFPPEYLEPLHTLWNDSNIQKTYERGNEVALPENLQYFYADLPRLFAVDFKPTEQDIIRCRARTIGIQQTQFKLKGHTLHMIDVGGQKSERRKWIHCFQDVTTILFLVSLSGYDQCLVEDKDANQMLDAMAIWDSICHSQWFKQTSLILFLNKVDLFEEKVKTSPIKTFFADYEGPDGDAEAGKEYFKKRFVKLSVKSNRVKEREIYTHFTNATDTELLRVVMAAVEGTVLRTNLSKAALI